MMMNIGVILMIALIAYWWAGQGFFSSLLHFASVVTAGAIAFATFEPIVHFVFTQWLDKFHDYMWGVSLIITFALSLAVLKAITDKACPGNIDFGNGANLIGGALLGIASGIITTGFVLIGLQTVQGPTELLGYRGWAIDNDGSIVKQEPKLWAPADEWTVWFYERASLGPLSTRNPLGKWYPDFAQQAALYRNSYDGGASRMGMKPDSLDILKTYRLIPNDENYVRERRGTVMGDQPAPTSGDVYIVRTSVNIGAADGGDKIRITKAQIRLVYRDVDGTYAAVHPHEFYQSYLTDSSAEWHWPFDTADLAAVSIGAASEAKFGFEFIIPEGAQPHHLIVKTARADINAGEVEDIEENELIRLITGYDPARDSERW